MNGAAMGETDAPSAVAVAADAVARCAPLFECTTERAGWANFVEIARQLMQVDITVAIEFIDAERAVVRAGLGYPDLEPGTVIPVPHGVQARFVADHADVTVSNDLDTETRFAPSRFLARHGIRSSMSMRLEMPAGHYAVIGAHSRIQHRFADADVALFVALGEVFGSVIVRLRRTDKLELSARIDPLTGLMNRASILETLDSSIAGHARPSVLLIDIDGFKAVNDTLGHRVGDDVLHRLAQRIESAIEPTDRLGRLGGDEFLLVRVDGTGSHDETVAERIIGHVEEVMLAGGRQVQVSASVGIARRRADDDSMQLLERSDRLMYAAKAAGRGEVRSDRLSPHQPEHLPVPTVGPHDDDTTSAASVAEAIAGLRIVVQPIIDSATGELHGVEALARGPLGHQLEMPDRLFPAARTHSQLGDLELAAKRLAFDLDLPVGVMLYVNLEPVLLASSSWMTELTAMWQRSGSPANVTVELTERAVLRSPGRLLHAVEVCRRHGWRIALDDVGSRSESLAALRWIDPDVVKLDMSLIADADRAHAAHVATAVASHRDGGHAGVLVIAEGVESPADAQSADVLGAELLQGYLFGRPGPPVQVLDLLGNESPAPVTWRRRDDGVRLATRDQLLDLSRHVESSVTSADTVLLASIQRTDNLTARTQRKYESLAKRCGFVGMVGTGLNAANVHEMRGVRLADLDPDHPLTSSWQVVSLSPTGSVALLADEVDPHDTWSPDRVFAYRMITDPDEVADAARRLLRYF